VPLRVALVRAIRAKCTDRMLTIGERHLRAALSVYVNRYNTGSSHQGHDMGLQAPITAWTKFPLLAPVHRISRNPPRRTDQ
jgi:putative transposase